MPPRKVLVPHDHGQHVRLAGRGPIVVSARFHTRQRSRLVPQRLADLRQPRPARSSTARGSRVPLEEPPLRRWLWRRKEGGLILVPRPRTVATPSEPHDADDHAGLSGPLESNEHGGLVLCPAGPAVHLDDPARLAIGIDGRLVPGATVRTGPSHVRSLLHLYPSRRARPAADEVTAPHPQAARQCRSTRRFSRKGKTAVVRRTLERLENPFVVSALGNSLG
jgi:hypothetical protein